MDKSKIASQLKRLKSQILAAFPKARVLVAGSLARGEYVDGSSDVDVIVISPLFSGKNLVQRLHGLNAAVDYPDFPVDLIPLLPEEYARKSKDRLNTLHFMAKDAKPVEAVIS